jgi:hypothetical protein
METNGKSGILIQQFCQIFCIHNLHKTRLERIALGILNGVLCSFLSLLAAHLQMPLQKNATYITQNEWNSYFNSKIMQNFAAIKFTGFETYVTFDNSNCDDIL